MIKKDFDVVVIGCGAGGVPAAIKAAQLGGRVAVVERDQIGGACMNRGCIPTKTLLETARLYHQAKTAEPFGLKFTGLEVDFPALMAKKADTINYLRMGTESVLKSNGVEIIKGQAAFSGPDRIQVNGQEYTAEYFILATGSVYAAPDIMGVDSPGVLTPDEVLNLEAVPASAAVWGSGPVELELAQYLNFLGAEVSIIEPGARILPGEGWRDVAARLAKELKAQGLNLLTRTDLKQITPDKGGLSLTLDKKGQESQLKAEILIHAARVPAVAGLNLDQAGLAAGLSSVLSIDPLLRTANPRIFAIGDVTSEATGGPLLSHRAAAMGAAAAQNALGQPKPFDHAALLRGLNTWPEAAAVGLTEAQAQQAGYEVIIGNIPFSTNALAMIKLATGGAVKVVAEAKYGRVLGVHIVGPGATELIGEAALALDMEATLDELSQSFRYHPSFSESQSDAAREALGKGIYVLR